MSFSVCEWEEGAPLVSFVTGGSEQKWISCVETVYTMATSTGQSLLCIWLE